MGFPLVRCQKALLATGNSDPEAAMEWLFAHMEDPGAVVLPPSVHSNSKTHTPLIVDIDEPIVIQSSGAGAGAGGLEPNEGQVSMLAEMGFTHAQARKALRETVRSHLAIPLPPSNLNSTVERGRRARRRVALLTPRRHRRFRSSRRSSTTASHLTGAIPPARVRIA